MAMRWECLETGCSFFVEAATDEELVAVAQAHVAVTHDSFELDEFILAGAVDVPEEQPQAEEGEARAS